MGYGVWGDESKPLPRPSSQRLRALALPSTVCGQTRANRTGRSLRSPTLRVVSIYAFQPHHVRLGISRCADRGVAVRTRVASALATGVGAGGCRGKEPIGGSLCVGRPCSAVWRGSPALGTNTCECASVEADTFVTASACILAAPRRPRNGLRCKDLEDLEYPMVGLPGQPAGA